MGRRSHRPFLGGVGGGSSIAHLQILDLQGLASLDLGALLHKFATDICEISLVLVCLYKTVSMASSCHGELFKTENEHDGFHVITRRLSCT